MDDLLYKEVQYWHVRSGSKKIRVIVWNLYPLEISWCATSEVYQNQTSLQRGELKNAFCNIMELFSWSISTIMKFDVSPVYVVNPSCYFVKLITP
jgi:hypothetical protein